MKEVHFFSKLAIEIDHRQVKRYVGLLPSAGKLKSVESLIVEEIRRGYELTAAEGGFVVHPIWETSDSTVCLAGTDFKIRSCSVAKLLRGAEKAVFFLVTIGSALEEEVSRCASRGEFVRSFILDAIGSVAVERLAEQATEELNELGETQRYHTTSRYSPGYGDWSLTAQKEILDLLGAECLGVRLTESSMLVPQKSITAVVGWHTKRAFQTRIFPCEECDLEQECSRFPPCGDSES